MSMSHTQPNGLGDPSTTPDEAGLGERARDQLEEQIADVRDAVRAAGDTARDTLAQGSSETARFVRENPALALAGALGVGVLIGLALGNGRR